MLTVLTAVLEYGAEVAARETEAYLLAPAGAGVTPGLHPLLTTRLIQRALYLENRFLTQACEVVAGARVQALTSEVGGVVEALHSIAAALRAAAAGLFSIEDYCAAFESAAEAFEGPGMMLVDALRRVRAALASGELPSTERGVERDLTRALGLLARAELRPG